MRKIISIMVVLVIIGIVYESNILRLQKEDYEVYNVILAEYMNFFGHNFPDKILRIEQYTNLTSLCFNYGSKENFSDLELYSKKMVSIETIKDYEKRNKYHSHLKSNLFDRKVLLVDKVKTNQYIDIWNTPGGVLKYPHITLSKVGYNSKKTEAVSV